MIDVIDSGISEKISTLPVIRHSGENFRFISSGRMDPHKGIDLSIEAIRHTREAVTLDVVGRGKEEERLKALVQRLQLQDRVRFLGWVESHDALVELMTGYRGYVFPSLAEANGIVVQEAMMLGLPVICLKWGGPAMLANDNAAILIEPRSREYVVRGIAAAMDRLACSADEANRLAQNARAIASRRFGWNQAIDEWKQAYV
jgi:glycosyltransferase involved in cell wall biosynthesis